MSEEAKADAKQEEPKKKGKLGLILIVLVTVIVAAGAGIGVAVMLGLGGEAKAEPAQQEAAAAAPSAEEIIISFDTFVVNLADQSGDRFMKVTMRLVITSSDLQSKIESDVLTRARMRDRILTVLSSRTYNDVSNPTGREILRHELVQELKDVLETQAIKEALFIEFVVQ